jgi:hypothetical protein
VDAIGLSRSATATATAGESSGAAIARNPVRRAVCAAAARAAAARMIVRARCASRAVRTVRRGAAAYAAAAEPGRTTRFLPIRPRPAGTARAAVLTSERKRPNRATVPAAAAAASRVAARAAGTGVRGPAARGATVL